MDTPTIKNTHLEGDSFFWPAGQTGVLLIHGFTATTAEVRPLGKFLHEKGYSVAGPLLPGHYTRPEDLNQVSWRDWVKAAEAMYQRLKSQCQQVIVGGESTGGLLSMALATEHPEIAALLLYAPALRLTLRPVDILRVYLAAPFLPWVTPKPGPLSVVDDRWQGYTVRPLKGLIQLLRLQGQVRQHLADIRQPTLICQGRLDNTVAAGVPDEIARKISSTGTEIHWMEKSSHCVILDCEIEAVFQITQNFITRITGGTP